MAYIFLDESGDLGFNFNKKKTSKYFIITCLFVKDKKILEKIIKRIRLGLDKKHKRKIGTLHCVKEKPITRRRFLKELSLKNCYIMTICLSKDRVRTNLQNEKPVLYNYVTNILLDRILTKKIIPLDEKIFLVASKRETNKFLNNNFNRYLKSQIQNKHKLNIEIIIKTPDEEKSLQAVDFVSWSIFRKYEYGEGAYYNLIKNKIKEENSLF